MKRIIMLVVLLLICCFACAEESTDVFTSGDYTYTLLEDGTAGIKYYTGNEDEIVIPSELDGHVVSTLNGFTNLPEFLNPDYSYKGPKRIFIPDSIVSINGNLFHYYSELETIDVSAENPVFASEDGVLFDKTTGSLIACPAGYPAASYEIPETTVSIGKIAFRGCKNLSSIIIPEGVIRIDSRAFVACSGLTSIFIPDSVSEMGFNPFFGCSALESIQVSQNHPVYQAVDGVLFDKNSNCLLAYPCARPGESYEIPEGTVSIGESAFADNAYLKNINIPEGVVKIVENAFYAYGRNEKIRIRVPDSAVDLEDYAFGFQSDVMLEVGRSSYAREYARENNYRYTFADGSDFDYALLEDGTIEITAYLGDESEITVPAQINGCVVKALGEDAFANNNDLRTITISDGISSVGKEAFYRCENLSEVSLPDSITHIGEGAFYNCSSLAEIYVPDGVAQIDDHAFGYSFSQDMVLIVNQLSHAKDYAKENYYKYRFVENSEYDYALLEDGTLEITEYLGEESRVTVPSEINGCAVTAIGSRAYAYCDGIESVLISDSITVIGESAFSSCENLASVSIPGSVTHIGEFAFYGCEALDEIQIPESVTEIGDYAFDFPYTKEITLVVSPASYAGEYAKAEGYKYALLGDSVFDYRLLEDGTIEITGYTGAENAIEIPSEIDGRRVSSVGDRALRDKENLISVRVPDSVTHIGEFAFGYSDKLVLVVDPFSYAKKYARENYQDYTLSDGSVFDYDLLEDGTLEIAAYFGKDSEIEIPSEIGGRVVSSIGDRALRDNADLTKVHIPDSITHIGSFAFGHSDSPVLVVNRFSYAKEYARLYGYEYVVPGESDYDGILLDDGTVEITMYTGGEECIEIPSELEGYAVSSIGEFAFEDNAQLRSVHIPDGVTSIGDWALFDCEKLEMIRIPESVSGIGENAFRNMCRAVFSVGHDSYAKGYAKENEYAYVFFDDSDFDYAVSPDGGIEITEYIGNETELEIPAELNGMAVTAIGKYAFYNCRNLESIVVPEGVKRIGEAAFDNCPNLRKAALPLSLEGVGELAFMRNADIVFVVDRISYARKYAQENGYEYVIYDGSTFDCTLLEDGSVEITACLGDAADLTIPSEINGYTVSAIGDKVFEGYTRLNSISIPDSVQRIGASAFDGCEGFEILASRNSYALQYAKEHKLDYRLNDIEYAQDQDRSAAVVSGEFEYILLKDGTAEITACSSDLEEIAIPQAMDGWIVAGIGDGAFSDCANLKHINVPETVTYIGEKAFYGCESLESINVPDSMASIGERAFYGCEKLRGISLPKDLVVIGEKAFYGCDHLELTLFADSAAELYAEENGISYTTVGGIENMEDAGFSMWKGIQFGDTIKEVEAKCAGEGDGDGFSYFEKDHGYTGEAEHCTLYRAGVAGIENVICKFYFNDAGKLSDVCFRVVDYTTTAHSHAFSDIEPTPYDISAVQASYKKITDGLVAKYGMPIDPEDSVNDRFKGIVLEGFINEALSFTTNETHIRSFTCNALYGNAWLIPLDNGGAVKIECMYEEYQQSCKNKDEMLDALGIGTWEEEGVEFRWGYSYIGSAEMKSYYDDVGSITDDL